MDQTMKISERIEAFEHLGRILGEFTGGKGERVEPLFSILESAIQKTTEANPWFTREFIEHSLRGWSENLRRESILEWLKPYEKRLQKDPARKNVAVIMAGNIPLVGFHDFLCVLLSGNYFTGRLSSNDPFLLPAIAGVLGSHCPGLEQRIRFTREKLPGFDAVIATGSNNTATHFEYYFSAYPHIIRQSRNGAAVLTGEETPEELSSLADDIFLYFGLGCRSVSKLFLPAGYDFTPLFLAFRKYDFLEQHHKWMNNHDYYRAIFQLNGMEALDNGFILLARNTQMASPPAVLYYEFYEEREVLVEQLSAHREEIQVVVSRREIALPIACCLPGHAQLPGLSDYADGIDTLQFLAGLAQ
jgi:hypothetical protein